MSDHEEMMPDEEEMRAMLEEFGRRITERLDGLVPTTDVVMLTSAQAQALLDEACYELDPGPSPRTVAEIRKELQSGTYIPCPNVVLARIETQRRCMQGRAFLEALANLDAGTWPCLLQEYPCERWSQVSSLYYSCLITSIAS